MSCGVEMCDWSLLYIMGRSSCFFRRLALVSLLALAASLVHASRSRTRLIPKLSEVMPMTCPDKKHHMQFNNVSIYMDRDGGEHVWADFTLLKGLQTFSKLTVVIHRCSLGVSGSCEFFSTWGWNAGLCQLAIAKSTLWFPVIDSVEPTFQCPLPKGRYVLHNGALNLHQIDYVVHRAKIDVAKYAWDVESQLFDEDRELNICYKFVVSFLRILERPKGLKNSSRPST